MAQMWPYQFHGTQANLYFNKKSFTSHSPCAPQSVKTFTLFHKYSLLRFFTRTIITCSVQIQMLGTWSIWRVRNVQKKADKHAQWCSYKPKKIKFLFVYNIPTMLKLLSRSSLLDFNLQLQKKSWIAVLQQTEIKMGIFAKQTFWFDFKFCYTLMSLFLIFTLSNAIFSNAIIKTTTTRWRNRGNTALWQVSSRLRAVRGK